MKKLRSRTVALLAVVALLACAAAFRIWNSQIGHLYQVGRHIERITPVWLEFQRTNRTFERVHLFAYTGGDGMFGAYGEMSSQSDLDKLRAFMESTQPPRPVYLGAVRVLPLDANDAEPDRAANRSQPIRAETNRMSVAAGSDR